MSGFSKFVEFSVATALTVSAARGYVNRVELTSNSGVIDASSTQTVTPPLCSYASPFDVVEAACQASGLHAVNVLLIDGDGRNTCFSPVCDRPFTPREIRPFADGSPCFKSDIMNVCQGPAVCVMPPLETREGGQIIQKVGVCTTVVNP